MPRPYGMTFILARPHTPQVQIQPVPLSKMEWRTARRPAVLPAGFIEPCNPTASKRALVGPGWIHEIKHDQLCCAGSRPTEPDDLK